MYVGAVLGARFGDGKGRKTWANEPTIQDYLLISKRKRRRGREEK